jgi:hypothetical protein
MRTWHNPATAWRRWLFLAFPLLATFALTLALAIPTSSAPVTETNIHVPVSGLVTQPCTRANVTLSGDDHLQTQVSRDNGAACVGVHVTSTRTPTSPARTTRAPRTSGTKWMSWSSTAGSMQMGRLFNKRRHPTS